MISFDVCPKFEHPFRIPKHRIGACKRTPMLITILVAVITPCMDM